MQRNESYKMKARIGVTQIIATAALVILAFSLAPRASYAQSCQDSRRLPVSQALLIASAAADELEADAARDLHSGRYADAEAQARIVNKMPFGFANDELGQALEAETAILRTSRWTKRRWSSTLRPLRLNRTLR